MNHTVRVLQLIDGLNFGGAEVLLRDLSAGLQKRGYSVQVGYCTPGPLLADLTNWSQQVKAPMPVHLPYRSRFDPALFFRMRRVIRSFRPHIVHTHLIKSDFQGRFAARVCRVPVVVSTLHNADIWAKKWPLGDLYGLNSRLADKVIAVSREVGNYHGKYSHIPSSKIAVIPNGINVKLFEHDPAAGLKIRSEMGLGETAPVLGIIGRLQPQKDHNTFLEAAALILKQKPNAHFLVVGDGPLHGSLESKAQVLGISSNVHFCGVRQDIPAIISALDILVFSSLWEGLPISLLEGMAGGRAIVATAVAGIHDVIQSDETGVLIDPGNPPALAEACLDLLDDPQRRQKMGESALRIVKTSFGIETMIDQVDLLYRQLLKRKNLPTPGGAQ